MKLETAMHVLIKECDFLGLKFEDLIKDLEQYPLAFPLGTIEAYKTYKDLAYI